MTARLQSAYSSDMWKNTIPQASYQYSAVKEALLAVGSRQLAGDAHPEWSRRLEHISLLHYGKALHHLSIAMPPLDVILLTCLLFIAYEHLGSPRKVTHARYGIKLVQDYRNRKLANVEVMSTDLLRKDLIPMFEGFVARALQHYFSLSYPDLDTEDSARLPPSVPDMLNSSFDAYVSLYGLMVYALEKFTAYESRRGSRASLGPVEDIRLIENVTSKWHTAFKDYSIAVRNIGELEENVRRILSINYRILNMVTQATLANSEMTFDNYAEDFEFILSNSVKAQAARHPSTETTLGLVPPLFFVATRCRDPALRRKALARLRAPHHSERMRNTCQAASIAERVIYLEERGLTDITRASEISQSRRLKLLHAHYDSDEEYVIAKSVRWSDESQSRTVQQLHIPLSPCDELLCSKWNDRRHVMRKEVILMKMIGGHVSDTEDDVEDALDGMYMHDSDADGDYDSE